MLRKLFQRLARHAAERLVAEGGRAEAAGRFAEACERYQMALKYVPGHVPAYISAPATAGDMQQLSTEIKLAAGDFVEVRVLQSSGGSLNVTANFFTMSWVAPG